MIVITIGQLRQQSDRFTCLFFKDQQWTVTVFVPPLGQLHISAHHTVRAQTVIQLFVNICYRGRNINRFPVVITHDLVKCFPGNGIFIPGIFRLLSVCCGSDLRESRLEYFLITNPGLF